MQQILKYFTSLSEAQKAQFHSLSALYSDWNAKINVISRKDIGNLYCHHVLHSLSIAEVIHFKDNTQVLDVGTGGGFPGIPLAIMFPAVTFTLIDGAAKKIKVVNEIAKSLELKNVEIKQMRAEEERGKFDFAVSRAVMPLTDLFNTVKKNILKEQKNALPNGLIALKGGELAREILPFKKIATQYNINDFFEEDYFTTKKVVFVPI
ncbi:MAG: 16S rRNA (guanine(527)-N(7))-methyltransferase RsmG [Prevotellaceae bacterium]|jgi:16S rRNA (guanine527-N7)-methyltransferase|nr:16S rRNA (guanine(527)-N(7))-methyltransferase RsmG [Prevotellaceae bacterium]